MNSYCGWLLMCLLFFSHTNAKADNSGVPMRLALGYLPPINCENSKMGVRCVNNRIAKRLQDFSGIEIQTKLIPYARATQMLQDDQTDMVLILKKDNMPTNAIGVAKVYEIEMSVFARLDAEDLAFGELRIGVLRGQGNNIVGRLAGSHLIELNEYRQGVEMLALGRLDALLGPDEVLNFLFDEKEMSGTLSPRNLLHFNQEVWLYCRKNACNDEILKRLRKAVIEIQPEIPELRKIMPATHYEYQ